MTTKNKINDSKTKLLKSKSLGRLLNIPNLCFKLEGENEIDTQKDSFSWINCIKTKLTKNESVCWC